MNNNQSMQQFLTSMKEGFNNNLPSILTAGSVVTMIATVSYAIYAGWKIKDVADDKELETKKKVKKIAFLSVPIACGACVSGACAIGANKQNKERYAALTALVATGAGAVNKDEVKDKIAEVTGKKSKNKKTTDMPVDNGETITITDIVTGFEFKTSIRDFWASVSAFNDMVSCNAEKFSLSCFFEDLFGGKGYIPDIYDSMMYGVDYEGKTKLFNPVLDVEMDGNMKPYYTIDYEIDK